MAKDNKPGKQRTLRRVVAALLVLIILATVAVAVIWPRHRESIPKDAVFVIDGHGYSQADVSKLTGYVTKRGSDSDDAARQAFGLLKRQRAAEKLGLKVPDQRVDAIARDNYRAGKQPDAWLRLLAYDDALTEVLGHLGKNGRVEGYVFFFNFSRYLLHGPAYTPPHVGDTKRIAADRAYAKEQAEHYRQALKDGDLSPEQAIKQIKADARLAEMGIKGSNASARFAGDQLRGNPDRNLPPEVADYVQRSSATTGLSQVLTGQALVNAAIRHPNAKDYADSYFFVVTTTAVDHQQSQTRFNQALKHLSARYIGFGKQPKEHA